MHSYLMNDLARATIDHRRAEATAWYRAKEARQAAARRLRVVAKLLVRPLVPAQRRPEDDREPKPMANQGRVS